MKIEALMTPYDISDRPWTCYVNDKPLRARRDPRHLFGRIRKFASEEGALRAGREWAKKNLRIL